MQVGARMYSAKYPLSPGKELIIKWFLPILLSFIGLIPAAKFYFEHLKEIEVSHWPTVNVLILTSSVDSYIHRGTKYFTPKITYEYKINGNVIRSDRVFYSTYSNNGSDSFLKFNY
jgi:hypothetical protein